MSTSDGLALLILVGLTAYTALGGADFGAGLWDLTRDRRQRELVVRSMGPVWEANHVWLIFVVIALFSGFPGAFAALSRALTGPLSIALLGIVLRGAAFAFRQYAAPYGGPPVRGTALWARVFAVSSLVTPFAFGAAAGGIATGQLRASGGTPANEGVAGGGGTAGLFAPFVAPLPLLGGLIAVAACAFLAAVYLTTDAHRAGEPQLVARLRLRALASGAAAGALALAALPFVPGELVDRIPWPAVAVSVVCGAAALELMRRGRFAAARLAAAGAPAGLLWGWALALYPWVLPGDTSLTPAPPATAGLILGVLVAGLLVVIPSYVFMVRTLRS